MKDNYLKAVIALIQQGVPPEELISGLKKTLDKRGHKALFGSVLRSTLQLLNAKGTASATIKVAKETHALTHKDEIAAHLKEFNADSAETIVDETLIGGYVVSTKKVQVDNSYKKKLVTLYRSLTT